MSHPSLGIKGATIINLILLLTIFFSILVQTSNINKPDIKKNIPLPTEDKISLIGNIDTQRIIETDNEPNKRVSLIL